MVGRGWLKPVFALIYRRARAVMLLTVGAKLQKGCVEFTTS